MIDTKKTLIIGNWKMNMTMHEASLYVHKLANAINVRRDVDVVLAPSTFMLQSLGMQVNRRQFKLAAQNLYWRDHGPFTGEVSAAQLRGIADYTLIGHSERRNMFNESDKDTRFKVQAALRNDITPVLCVGETQSERPYGETADVLNDQVLAGLANVTSEEVAKVVIAYEPVWAIGTGLYAKPEDVKSAINVIRHQIEHLYGKKAASEVRVLYGGSIDADNAGSYLQMKEVDGLLIGGSSLKFGQFTEIIKKAHKREIK